LDVDYLSTLFEGRKYNVRRLQRAFLLELGVAPDGRVEDDTQRGVLTENEADDLGALFTSGFFIVICVRLQDGRIK